jgi:hypothetical protein
MSSLKLQLCEYCRHRLHPQDVNEQQQQQQLCEYLHSQDLAAMSAVVNQGLVSEIRSGADPELENIEAKILFPPSMAPGNAMLCSRS